MTRRNNEGVGDCSANPPSTNQVQQEHFANDDGPGKALAAMEARAALCGATLVALADGGYYLARWNYATHIPDLRAVSELLRRIGGQA